MNHGYAIFDINRNCWVYKFDQDQNQISYRNEPTIFQKTIGDIVIFMQKIANATGNELKLYQLTQHYSGASFKPSLASEMSKYTNQFAPKTAEFIHNTAIKLGRSKEHMLEIAKNLAEGFDKALKGSVIRGD